MIIFGTRTRNLKASNITSYDCKNCNSKNSVQFHFSARYFHVFWIPVLPFSKVAISQCSHCKQAFYKEEMSQAMKQDYLVASKQVKSPITHYSGLLIIGLAMIFIIGSIVFSEKNNVKGEPINLEQFHALNELKENDGKRFSIVGYPFIDKDVTIRNKSNTRLESQLNKVSFYEKPNGKGAFISDFPLPNGKKRNHYFVPDDFTIDDVVFYDNNGKPLKHTEKMLVSFTMDLQTDRATINMGSKEMYYGSPIKVRLDKAE